jgi:hypothetical protein
MSLKIPTWIRICMVLAAILASGSRAEASDFYVAQNTTGSGSGSDPSDCLSLASVNSIWPARAGDTIHLVGTLTNTLTIGGSGTAGSPTTIYFEPNAKFSAPTLAITVNFINMDSRSWIVIDGGSNGLLELTDNGTAGNYDYQNNAVAVYGASAGVDHVTIKNLSIRNLYQRTTNTDSGTAQAIYIIGSDVTYSNLTLGEAYDGIRQSYTPSVTSNLTIVNCTFTNYNHAIEIGAGASVSPAIENIIIENSVFQSGDMFETYSGGEVGLHRNAIFIFDESGMGGFNRGVYTGCISNLIIAGNYIKHGWHPLGTAAGSGAMFFDGGSYFHVRVFNNVSTLAYPLQWSGGGGLVNGQGTDVLVANNTAIMWQTNGVYGGSGSGSFQGLTIGGTNVWCYNNVDVGGSGIWITAWVSVGNLTNNLPTLAWAEQGIISDYNIYNGQNGNSFVNMVVETNGLLTETLLDSFSQWRNTYSIANGFNFDAHSTTASVQLNSNFQPLSTDTVAIGHGTNLTAFAIADNLPGLTNDFAGNPRPATGNWTIGAYNASGSSPAPLVSLVALPASITNGQSSTLQWSSVNAKNVTLSSFGLVAPSGTTNISPAQATTYTATATSANGTNSTSVSVIVAPAPPSQLHPQ